jgi:hypothetical protein
MQKRAGILFLSKQSSKVLIILEDTKWTVPTFEVASVVMADAAPIIETFYSKPAKLIPLELYVSSDNGFEFSTYVCLVDNEFTIEKCPTYCWASFEQLPKNLHTGLKTTLTNKVINDKINTMLVVAQQL